MNDNLSNLPQKQVLTHIELSLNRSEKKNVIQYQYQIKKHIQFGYPMVLLESQISFTEELPLYPYYEM